MIKHLKKTSLLLTSLLLLAGMSAPAQGATALTKTQQAKVSAVFKAIASSNPDSMSSTRKNLSGSADLAVFDDSKLLLNRKIHALNFNHGKTFRKHSS
jgi:hypothetical protein